jgi:hypothetical protein
MTNNEQRPSIRSFVRFHPPAQPPPATTNDDFRPPLAAHPLPATTNDAHPPPTTMNNEQRPFVVRSFVSITQPSLVIHSLYMYIYMYQNSYNNIFLSFIFKSLRLV